MSVRVRVDVECGDDDAGCRVRPVFVIGPFRDAPGAVETTRDHYRFPITGEITVALTMTAVQECDVALKAVDKKGNPASLDGVPEWATDNSDVLALAPSADGKTCKVTATGVLGTARVQCTADADLGAGSVPIIGTLDVEVTPGQATTVVLEPGTPTDQP